MILKDLYKNLKKNNRTLIDTSVFDKDYLTGYGSELDLYYLSSKFGTLEVISDDPEEINDYVIAAIKINDYKWQKLYDTLELEYNPIWNYDGTTTTTEVRGARSEEDVIGEGHGNTIEKTAPFDSSNVRNVNEVDNMVDSRTDSHSAESYTDTITETRGGNQGTTTTQQMIKEEREISDFKLWDVIYADIIDMITFPYFGEV